MTYLITGMFDSQQVSTIEEARAILQFAYDRQVQSEAYLFDIQCRTNTGENTFNAVSVPSDTTPFPVADEYAVFNTHTGVYQTYSTFEQAKTAAEFYKQKRAQELLASHSISEIKFNPATNIEEWVVIETMPFVPSRVPKSVTRFQALVALADGGWLPVVRVYINALDENNITRLAFENATDWERTSPTINAIAQMLGLSEAQVDLLFIHAAQVTA